MTSVEVGIRDIPKHNNHGVDFKRHVELY
jgi:hypothetical protein